MSYSFDTLLYTFFYIIYLLFYFYLYCIIIIFILLYNFRNLLFVIVLLYYNNMTPFQQLFLMLLFMFHCIIIHTYLVNKHYYRQDFDYDELSNSATFYYLNMTLYYDYSFRFPCKLIIISKYNCEVCGSLIIVIGI